MNRLPEHIRVECPRCGYALRGTVVAWTDTCPLDGRCAECGLPFAWREILNPRFAMPDWCVEHDGRGRLRLGQIVGTFGRCFRPRRFWHEIQIGHPNRWSRVLAYFIAGLLVV